ncbi:MAG: lytic murein transglycosylase [Porticoccaceae bacterium]|jgi:membrane-bound lytic murein transglycosylase B
MGNKFHRRGIRSEPAVGVKCWKPLRLKERRILKICIPFSAVAAFLTASLVTLQAQSADTEFQSCLAKLQQQARQQNLSAKAVTTVAGMEQQQRVLELDRKQPEFAQTFGQYLETRVSADRVRRGREMYSRHRAFLDQLTAKYGVPGQYLVAFWGLETNYGGYLGNMPTLDSLATLACDPRRSDFFTSEFLTALKVMDRESLEPQQMRGSWAGAVGHTQFMPSNYIRFAVDGDGDGRIDLWRSEKDALASGANFLNHLGWQEGFRWGREVILPVTFDYALAGRKNARSLKEWVGLGVRLADDSALPATDVKGSILVPAGHRGPAFIVYDNFAIIMNWNRSESYALSVGLLADRIAGGGGLRRPPPADQRPLARADVLRLQMALNDKGYDAGEPDGIFGSGTRKALSAYQKDNGRISDGFPDRDVVETLLQGFQ